MTLKDHLLKLLESETWANTMLAETVEKAKQPDDRVFFLFSHLLNSYSMWLSRIRGTDMTTGLFQERSLEENKSLMHEVLNGLKKHLHEADEKEVDRVIVFIFPHDGSKKKLSVADAISHLVTHSTYHRGQIMARLKGQVDTLPLTTYIAYAMEKAD